MTKREIIVRANEIIEHLYAAQPGMGTSANRQQHRDAASQMLHAMPKDWWRKVPESVIDRLTALV